MAKGNKKRKRSKALERLNHASTMKSDALSSLGKTKSSRFLAEPTATQDKPIEKGQTIESGKRCGIELPPEKKFLSSQDGESYQIALDTIYNGFAVLPADEMPRSFHSRSRATLEALQDAGYYQYDIVMAGGKKLSRTFVKRTLVGEPGLTYKYLGLRLFCHSWGDDAQPMFRAVRRLNQDLIRMTKEAQTKRSDKTHGSCEYNLTLINYMPPSSSAMLRDEPSYGMGKTSVSWHADSSLQDMSCIAVYHTVPGRHNCDWRIALRRNPDDNLANAIPPIVASTKSGDAYFLLDEFNHQFQHTVLAGSASHRISSTHRVAVESTDTYEYIRSKVSKALVSIKQEIREKKSINEWDVNVIVAAQEALTEVEFEWIAQYWVQGSRFNEQHRWWQGRIQALEKAWDSLEKVTFEIAQKLLSAGSKTSAPLESGKLFLKELEMRQALRQKWDKRRAESIYRRQVAAEYRPVERPVFIEKCNRLPKDLSTLIHLLHGVYE